jgi:hypothetical protein
VILRTCWDWKNFVCRRICTIFPSFLDRQTSDRVILMTYFSCSHSPLLFFFMLLVGRFSHWVFDAPKYLLGWFTHPRFGLNSRINSASILTSTRKTSTSQIGNSVEWRSKLRHFEVGLSRGLSCLTDYLIPLFGLGSGNEEPVSRLVGADDIVSSGSLYVVKAIGGRHSVRFCMGKRNRAMMCFEGRTW